MSTNVTRVTTHGDGTIFVWSAVCVDRVGAVVLLVSLAVVAGQVSLDLGTNTDTVEGISFTVAIERQWCVLPVSDSVGC